MVAEPQILGEEEGQLNISSVALDIKQVGMADLKHIMRLDIKEMDPDNLTGVEKATSYG